MFVCYVFWFCLKKCVCYHSLRTRGSSAWDFIYGWGFSSRFLVFYCLNKCSATTKNGVKSKKSKQNNGVFWGVSTGNEIVVYEHKGCNSLVFVVIANNVVAETIVSVVVDDARGVRLLLRLFVFRHQFCCVFPSFVTNVTDLG